MAGLDLYAVQEEIVAHIRAEFPNYTVEEDDVIDDNYILRVDGNTKPFLFVRHSTLLRQSGNASFGGVRHDEYTSSFDIAVIAPSAKIARQISNLVTDRLIGWKLSSGPALIPTTSGMQWAVNDNNGRPHLYVSSSRFQYAVNAENVSQNVTP